MSQVLNWDKGDLLETHLLLEQVFENAADGMCILNMDYEIIKASNRLLSTLDLIKEDVIGKKCYDIVSLSLCNTDNCPMKRIKKGESYFTYEAQYNIGKKSVPFLVTATPFINSNNEIAGLILSYKDISDLIKYQKDLQAAKDKAEEENILKSQFLANMSHEIRTPMNGILGLLELLRETELSPKQQEYMDLIKYSTDRLLSIINDILDFSKIRAKKLEIKRSNFNIIHLLDKMKKYFRLQAGEKGLDLHWNIDDKIPNILIGDSEALSQILFNLLSNAIKFTDKGYIGLDVDIYGEDDKGIEVIFTVTDTGIGIPEGKIKDIFKEFYQIDLSSTKKYGGSGLGLTISKELVEAMDGQIHVSSQMGIGSKFILKLKFEKSNLRVNDEKSEEEKTISPNRYNNLNILVVEDDFINQKIIYSMLEKNNWNITLESHGEKVLDLIKENTYDLIILDIFMPGMDGYEIARQIRNIESIKGVYTPIIAITATTTLEYREKCENIGFDGIILKPISRPEAYEKIIHVLNKNIGISPVQIDKLLNRIDNNEGLLKELIEEAISDTYEEEYLGNMATYIANKDFVRLKEVVHKFKGSISNFGAKKIIKLLEEIGGNIEKANVDLIKELYGNLKDEFFILRQEFSRIIESKDLY